MNSMWCRECGELKSSLHSCPPQWIAIVLFAGDTKEFSVYARRSVDTAEKAADEFDEYPHTLSSENAVVDVAVRRKDGALSEYFYVEYTHVPYYRALKAELPVVPAKEG